MDKITQQIGYSILFIIGLLILLPVFWLLTKLRYNWMIPVGLWQTVSAITFLLSLSMSAIYISITHKKRAPKIFLIIFIMSIVVFFGVFIIDVLSYKLQMR